MALAIAQDNAAAHGLDDAVTFLRGDWFEPVESQGRCFDLIVSNPPYVSHAELDRLAPEVSQYEPREALDGGPDGLDAIRLIIERAIDHMSPGAWLLFEIGYDQRAEVERLLTTCGTYDDFCTIKDCSGLDRVIRARAK